jgi:hypothetical protein
MGLGIDNLKSDQNITIRSVYGKIGESAKRDKQTNHKSKTHEKETMNDEEKNISDHRRF